MNSKEGYVLLFLIIVALAYYIVSILGKTSKETKYVFAFLVLYAILVLVGIIPPFRTRIGSSTTPTVMIGFIIISAIFAGYLTMKKQQKGNEEY